MRARFTEKFIKVINHSTVSRGHEKRLKTMRIEGYGRIDQENL